MFLIIKRLVRYGHFKKYKSQCRCVLIVNLKISKKERETFLLCAYVRSCANSHIFDYRDKTTLILD